MIDFLRQTFDARTDVENVRRDESRYTKIGSSDPRERRVGDGSWDLDF